MKLHLIHVAGTLMIEKGTYGSSQGNQLEGVLRGFKIIHFVPIHESALCQEILIIYWIRTWKSYPEL